MVTVVCAFYEGVHVPTFSRCYTPDWVERLYRGVQRHYTKPFEFLCYTDRAYAFTEPIRQMPLTHTRWATCLQQCFAAPVERMVFMGLDTVITGNVDEIFAYEGALAVPIDPYRPGKACSGVVLCPSRPDIAATQAENDMLALEPHPHEFLDDLFPGQIVSYKAHVREQGLGDARIVYFHGDPKPHQLQEAWVKEHWYGRRN